MVQFWFWLGGWSVDVNDDAPTRCYRLIYPNAYIEGTLPPEEPPGWKKTLKYATQPMSMVDFLSILPYYLSYFHDIGTRASIEETGTAADRPSAFFDSSTSLPVYPHQPNQQQTGAASPSSCAFSA